MNSLLPYFLAIVTAGLSQPATPLSVADAVRIALAGSPHLRAAHFDAEAAQAQAERDRPVARPDVTVQAQGTLQGPRVTFPRAGDGDAAVLPERFGRVELDVEQTLYHAGVGAARTRYGAQTRANAWDYQRAENDAILEVRRSYYSALTAESMAQVARDGVTLAQKHLDLTRLMLQAGNASERDVKASDADLADAEQGAIKAENGVALARANLNRVMGRNPDAPLTLAPAPPLPAVPDSPDAGIAQALARRPEIRALEEGLVAAKAGATLAGTQGSPTLSARATAARQTPSAFVNENYLAASLIVKWNPFDTGKARADVAEARAQSGKLAAQLDEARLGIRVEVEKAWRDMREARARIDAAERQVTSAEAALEVSELRYQVRSATQLEVSGALLDVTKARANRAQAINDLHMAAADYAHATGADVPEKVTGISAPREPRTAR